MIESAALGHLNLWKTNGRMYESSRITVQILLALTLISTGCTPDKHASVPVSIKQQPPYSYQGRIERIWGGDNFEIVDNGKLHFAYMRGIVTPKPGQNFHEESKLILRQLSRQQRTTIHVIDRDEWKREICDVTITDKKTQVICDPALELIKNGLGWYDQSDGPYADDYRNAELEAREKQIGIWSHPSPVAPWDYWQLKVKQIQSEQ